MCEEKNYSDNSLYPTFNFQTFQTRSITETIGTYL